MKQTIGRADFIESFMRSRPENFSSWGLSKLWDYFQEYERDTGEEMELDVIAICCEYAEDEIENVLKEYELEDIEDLRERTHVVAMDDELVIYQQF